MKNITILGATGSIGTQTLEIIDLHRDKFNVFALSAHSSVKRMQELIKLYTPKYVVMINENAARELKECTNNEVIILAGSENLEYIASDPEVDVVMSAIVGSAGMKATLAAVIASKRLLLANKESLVLAGQIIMSAANKHGSQIIPVDSEHSAIFQALEAGKSGLHKIQLTASGGPFLNTDNKDLTCVTPSDACAHPNWSMGAKISVDSATMMNKGLEIIEAHYLFNIEPSDIDVVIHPRSIIHSSVYFKDGSVLSQLGNPDMRTAISYAMSYPQRIFSGVPELDLTKHTLEFYPVDYKKFKSLKLAYSALKSSHAHIGALNAANEEAVFAFLEHKIPYLDIVRVIEHTLEHTNTMNLTSLEDIVENDKNARIKASEYITRLIN